MNLLRKHEEPTPEVSGGHSPYLAARREWERVNGISLRDWFDELLEETLEAGATLTEVNMAFSAYLTEPDDWSDPRQPAA